MSKERIINWFGLHETAAGGGVLDGMESISIGDVRFYLSFCAISGPYRVVYAYAVPLKKLPDGVSDNIKCRIFYYSCSEASWRAWTGGGWYKGTNTLKGHFGADIEWGGAGYIYECMVHDELALKLEEFYVKYLSPSESWRPASGLKGRERSNDDDNSHYSGMVDDRYRHFVYNTYIGDPTGRYKRGVMGEYDLERKMVKIIDESQSYGKSIKAGGFLGSSVNIQKLNKSKMDSLQGEGIWASLLIPCLDNPVSDLPEKKHPSLGDAAFRTKRYRLDASRKVFIDISYLIRTESFSTTKSFSNKAHCCWVSNMHIEGAAITTFGTYKEIPIDLSFIIQKPIDYISQVGDEYRDAMGVSMSPRYAEFQYNRIIKSGLAGYSDYVALWVINDLSSPLLRGFKSKMGFSEFRIDYARSEASLLLEDGWLKAMAMNGVIEYLTLNSPGNTLKTPRFVTHGESGIKRAKDLMTELERGARTTPYILFELFSKGRINGVGGYDSFGNRIRTNENSLFTCILRNTIAMIPPSITDYRMKPGGAQWGVGDLTGPDGCVNRMLVVCAKKYIAMSEPNIRSLINASADDFLKALRNASPSGVDKII